MGIHICFDLVCIADHGGYRELCRRSLPPVAKTEVTRKGGSLNGAQPSSVRDLNRSVMVVTARQDLLDYCDYGGGEPAFRDLTLLGHLAIRTLTYSCLVHRCQR